MSFSMEDFIEEVRIRPAIYDITLPEYSDRGYKRLLWTEICQKFTLNWNQLSEENKDVVGREMKNRWKSIRDAFVREVRYLKEAEVNGDSQVKKRKYIYYDQLLFLLPTVGARNMRSHSATTDDSNQDDYSYSFDIKPENHFIVDNSEDDIKKSKKNRKSYKRKFDLFNNGEYITTIREDIPWNNSNNNNNNNNNNNENDNDEDDAKNNVENNVENVEEERLQVTPSIEDIIPEQHVVQPDLINMYDNSYEPVYRPDPDYMFLMSLIPSFKKLGDERKSSLKIEISSLLHEAVYGSIVKSSKNNSSDSKNNNNNHNNNINNDNSNSNDSH